MKITVVFACSVQLMASLNLCIPEKTLSNGTILDPEGTEEKVAIFNFFKSNEIVKHYLRNENKELCHWLSKNTFFFWKGKQPSGFWLLYCLCRQAGDSA